MSEPQSPEMRLAKAIVGQTKISLRYSQYEHIIDEFTDIIARETGLSELLEAAEEVASVGLSIETTERLEAAIAKTKGENHG